jgi:hypothetical protein
MTAIATDDLKFRYSELLFTEIKNATDSNHFYVGIGKSDQYDSANDTIIDPVNRNKDHLEARNNLQSLLKIAEGSMSYVVPRSNWVSGTPYESWKDHHDGIPSNKYYVMTDNLEVFICLENSKSTAGDTQASTINPSSVRATLQQGHGIDKAFKTSDGYIWKFLYAIETAKQAAFLSSNFMPLQNQDSAGNLPGVATATTSAQTDQAKVRKCATSGQVLGVEVVNAGGGYTGTPTITITGDGAGAAGLVVMNGTSIGHIQMIPAGKNAVTTMRDSGMGSGYNFARVEISGADDSSTTHATLRAIIGPRDGIGSLATHDLKSSSLMFNVKPAGTQSGTFNISQDFRQISLLRNLDYTDSAVAGNRVTQGQARVGRICKLTSGSKSLAFQTDEKITQSGGAVVGWVDYIDSDGSTSLQLYYHHNERVDLKSGPFIGGQTVTGSVSGITGTVSTDTETVQSGLGAIDRYSGDILYIDNRARIERTETQTEDIKIILSV